MFTGHKMGPPLCGTGNGRDGDKLLCNRCPLKHEAREREGWSALQEHVWLKTLPPKNLRKEVQLIFQVHDIYVVWAQPSVTEYRTGSQAWMHPSDEDLWMGSGMVASIQWMSHVMITIIHKMQPGCKYAQSGVLRSNSTRTQYKFKHVNMGVEVEHAWTSSDYQPMMKAINKRERCHQ